MSKTNHDRSDVWRWRRLSAVVATLAFGVGGIAGGFGRLGQDVTIACGILLLCGGALELTRRTTIFVCSGEARRLYASWRRGGRSQPQGDGWPARVETLTQAVGWARQAEHDAERLYGFARCAPEEVVRARAVRVQAEIALLRHRVAELQVSYRR